MRLPPASETPTLEHQSSPRHHPSSSPSPSHLDPCPSLLPAHPLTASRPLKAVFLGSPTRLSCGHRGPLAICPHLRNKQIGFALSPRSDWTMAIPSASAGLPPPAGASPSALRTPFSAPRPTAASSSVAPSASASSSAGPSFSAATSPSVASPSSSVTFYMATLRRAVDDANIQSCVWSSAGDAVVIKDEAAFTKDVLPNFTRKGKSTSFPSFRQTLSFYGFAMTYGFAEGARHAVFTSPDFKRGQLELMSNLQYRRPPSKRRKKPASGKGRSSGTVVGDASTRESGGGESDVQMGEASQAAVDDTAPPLQGDVDDTAQPLQGVEGHTPHPARALDDQTPHPARALDDQTPHPARALDDQTPHPARALDDLIADVQALGLADDCQRLCSAVVPLFESIAASMQQKDAQIADQAIAIQRLSSGSEEKGRKILRLEGQVKTLEEQNVALYESLGEAWGAADVASSQAQAQAQGCDEEAGTEGVDSTMGAEPPRAAGAATTSAAAAGGSSSSSETAGAPPCKRARLAEEDAEEEEEDDEDAEEDKEEDEEDGDEDAEMKMTVGDSEQVDGQDEGMEGT